MTSTQFEQAVRGFIKAADFQIGELQAGRFRKFTTNYCREHYRAATGDPFTNTHSPMILKEVVKRRPDLSRWIDVK